MLKNLNQIVQHNIKRLSVFLVMGTVIVASTISVTALSQRVYIEDGENVTTLYSIKTEVADALKQAGVELGPDDTTEKTDNEDGTRIKVFRAFPVTVVDDEETIEVNISRGTVMDAVDKSGLTVGAEDIVSPLSSTELSNGMEINILRRYNITLIMGKEVKNLVVPAGTVREALKFLELPLGDEDSVNVDPESKVFEGMEINLTRVEYTERKEEEEVPYSKTTTMTDSLYEGERKVESGKNGTKEITLKDKIVNGEVVETKRVSEEIIVAAKNEVTYVGVKKKNTGSSSGAITKGYSRNNENGTFTDHTGKTVAYKYVLSGSATAYTASAGALTSTGKVAKVGMVAVDPRVIPYGTKVFITLKNGSVIGYATTEDTGGAMLEGKRLVDIYYSTESECFQFGVKDVNVYVL